MTKLDILMIGPFPAEETRVEGGVQASVLGLARRLAAHPEVARLRVVAVPNRVGGRRREGVVAGIPVTFLAAPGRFLISMMVELPRVAALIRRSPGTIVHLHGSGPFEFALLLLCRLLRVPVVWTLHGITEKETYEAWRRRPSLAGRLRHLLYRFCERGQLRLADRIVVDTPYVAREIADRTPHATVAVPQGISLDELMPHRSLHRRGATVLALGVIEPRKGHLRTVEAFAAVARTNPDAHLRIVGALRSPEHLAEIEAAVRAHGLETRVEILVDRPRAEILAALAEARVLALHSEEESQGIALCEAMAVGLPIVATRVGGIPDVLADSGAGVMVELGDVAGMADAIRRYLADETACDAASRTAVDRARDFDWADVTRRLLAVYRPEGDHRGSAA
jgi:glycosyltransferase involved in cell wall biosynthesis